LVVPKVKSRKLGLLTLCKIWRRRFGRS